MNEIVSALIEHGAEFAILDPALRAAGKAGLEIAKDIIGPQRLDEITGTFERAREKLRRRKVEPRQPPLTVLIPLLEAAQDENRDELREIWASLLAAAADPTRTSHFRREFIDIAKQLDPIDALVLKALAPLQGSYKPSRLMHIIAGLEISRDDVMVSFGRLATLRLATEFNNSGVEHNPELDTLGRLFMKAIAD
ncbi:MAG: DUF4393 domain-containing protein [Alphaproteobacteria bacterium]|nr:DUF4393 domain-containing protein [Alphaproteobacteria bacterium]